MYNGVWGEGTDATNGQGRKVKEKGRYEKLSGKERVSKGGVKDEGKGSICAVGREQKVIVEGMGGSGKVVVEEMAGSGKVVVV